MKIKQYLESTVSANIDSYDVPYANGKGYIRVDIPPKKRNKKNLPDGVKIEDWLKIDTSNL